MAAFQDIREKTEQKIMVHLLSEIDKKPSFTQRGLASELGIALGLMNHYLKRCLAKGWVRASQISPKRISYFLTPEGFKEKSLMVTEYLSNSMAFFKLAKEQCEQAFTVCQSLGFRHIALVGDGDLADIAKLVAHGFDVCLSIVNKTSVFKDFDAIFITDIIDPQGTYDSLKNKIDEDRLITIKLLHISKKV